MNYYRILDHSFGIITKACCHVEKEIKKSKTITPMKCQVSYSLTKDSLKVYSSKYNDKHNQEREREREREREN